MNRETIKITNSSNEELDVVIEGNLDANIAIVFAHGMGSNKDENFNLLLDIAGGLADEFRIFRFDFSGYGKSGGNEEDMCLSKMADDLSCVINHANDTHQKVFLLAHSLGVYATLQLQPKDVEKIVFTSPPSMDFVSRLQKKITEKGGALNKNKISLYPRTSGETQKLGPKFWQEVDLFSFSKKIKRQAVSSKIAIFDPLGDHPMNDDLISFCQRLGIDHYQMEGDHNFINPQDRGVLIKEINNFFKKTRTIFIAHPVSGDVENNIQKIITICSNIHSAKIIPVFPSLLSRNYLSESEEDRIIKKNTIEEYFKRGFIDEIWYYNDSLSSGMKNEVDLGLKYGVPNIGKSEKMQEELFDYIK